MGESHHLHQAEPPSRLGIRSGGGGEIVEVQGGHIVRSTGRKDRHSKVCTAKGPRDRRVRLSAHTAIQFYDVQDRLGYDRPSKAVDWLIKKAKASIDELAVLPAWTPTSTIATVTATANPRLMHQEQLHEEENENENKFRVHGMVDTIAKRAATTTTAMVGSDNVRNIHHQMGENPTNSSSFLPPSLDSDAIADTIKSFFPMGASAETPSSTIQFQNYPPDLLSRTSSQSQDLRLSLQSFQDPMLLHHHHQQAHNQAQEQQNEHVLFSGTGPIGFDGSSAGWSHHHHAEISRFQRMMGWNAGGVDTGNSGGSGGSGGGFMFHSPPTTTLQPPLQPLFGHNQLFSQRGPLQSSNTPSVRAWIDPSITASDHQHHQIPTTIHQSSISGIGYASGGFSGFRIPARIQGEEEHDGTHNKLSSASSDSRH